MSSPRAEEVLNCYSASLTALEEATAFPSTKGILAVLTARDAVHAVLSEEIQVSLESLITIIELDDRLKKQAGSIAQAINLADWRSSLNPDQEAWWWFLEPSTQVRWLDRVDWLWSALAVLCLTAVLSLVVDISSRFLSDGPDTLGAFAVVAQSILTLLTVGGALTPAGQKAVEHMLNSLHIPGRFRKEIRFGLALLLLLSLVSFHYSLDRVASYYNNRGYDKYFKGQFMSAQDDYRRALKLNPDYVDPHYNLGLLYEDLQNFTNARTEYQIAVQGGRDAAFNNLARLYIRDKDYSAAVPLLLQARKASRNDQVKGDDSETKVKYDILKNLGWARLGQKRYDDAEVHLREAIALASRRAPAYCILAQVLEGQNDKAGARTEWEKCLAHASEHNPDEDAWIAIGRPRAPTPGDK